MSYFIGIDLGASFIKSALFDTGKFEISQIIKLPSPQPNIYSKEPPYLRFETDVSSYEKIVKQIISKYLKADIDIKGIVFSTQMHGMVLTDSTLNALTPFIGWQDERILEKAEKHKQSLKFSSPTGGSNYKSWLDLINNRLTGFNTSNTGIKFKSGLMGSTLFWLKENNLLNKSEDTKALFLGDYIAAKITGGKRVVDVTNACGSGLFNVNKRRWDKKILQALGLGESLLPEVVNSAEAVGFYKINNKKIPVYVSVGDLQAAVLGSLLGLGRHRQICINIGTGSQVSFVGEKFKVGNYDIRSYFDGGYLYTITHIPAGRALNVVIRFVEDIGKRVFNQRREIDIWEKLASLTDQKTDGQSLQSSISFFKNNVTGDTTGSFTNITENNLLIDNLFYAALERMAENYFLAYQRLGKLAKTDTILCAGGLARKLKPLRRLIEKRFNRKIFLAEFEEETLAGLFILSLVCRRDFKNLKSASLYCKKNKIKFSNEKH